MTPLRAWQSETTRLLLEAKAEAGSPTDIAFRAIRLCAKVVSSLVGEPATGVRVTVTSSPGTATVTFPGRPIAPDEVIECPLCRRG